VDVEAVSDGLERHVREFFAPRQVVERPQWIAPHARARLPRLRVLEVAPDDDAELWAYVSVGVWEVTKEERHGLELVYLSETAGRVTAEHLVMTAYYHANPDDESYRLWEGHTIPIGEPIVTGSHLDHLLVSRPYPLGPDFELAVVDDVSVHFFWLLPITDAERRFRHERDLEALESRFDEIGLQYWRLDRASAI
jgi:hypothetical protein